MTFTFGNKTIMFNEQFAASKSLEDFIKHEKHHGLTDDQFKEVYELCVKKCKSEKQMTKKAEPLK